MVGAIVSCLALRPALVVGNLGLEEEEWGPVPPTPSAKEAEPQIKNQSSNCGNQKTPYQRQTLLEDTSTSHALQIPEADHQPSPVPQTVSFPSTVSHHTQTGTATDQALQMEAGTLEKHTSVTDDAELRGASTL